MLSCVLIRNFAAAVERKHNPELRQKALVIATDARLQRVVASSGQPRHLGVMPKMSVKQALLLCPEAAVLTVNEGAYKRIAEEIAEGLGHFANRIELEYQPTSTAFYLDTDAETEAIQAFIEACLPTRTTAGIASNKLTARVAAASAGPENRVIRVEKGQESDFLAPHPVTVLPLSKDMERRLPMLGIDTLGQYASLPKMAAWEQFGKHGKWLHDLARGIDLRTIQPFQPPRRLCAQQLFDTGIHDREILRAVLRRMGQTLIERLAGEQASRLSLLLTLENQRLVESHSQPQQPVQDLLYLLRRVDDLLNQQVIDAPVSSLVLHLTDIHRPQPRQLSLFDHMEEQRRLKTVVPEWIVRHPETGFYSSDLTSESPYALPEDRFILRELTAMTSMPQRQERGA